MLANAAAEPGIVLESGGAGQDHHAHSDAQDAQQHPGKMPAFQQAPAIHAQGEQKPVQAEGRRAAAGHDLFQHRGLERN